MKPFASCSKCRQKENLHEGRTLIPSAFLEALHMSGFNSFQPSVGTSASFGDPSLQMSDGGKVDGAFSCASAGFKLSQALAESAWEKRKGEDADGGDWSYCF